MFQFPTATGNSLIAKKQTGVFAAKDIPKDAIVWRWEPEVDRFFTWDSRDDWSPGLIFTLQNGGYRKTDEEGVMGVALCGDDARFLRQSLTPNLEPSEDDENIWVATKNIAAGEELTIDYHVISLDANAKINNSEWLIRRLTLPVIPFVLQKIDRVKKVDEALKSEPVASSGEENLAEVHEQE